MNAGLAKLDEIDPDAPERIGKSLREVAEYARLGHKNGVPFRPGFACDGASSCDSIPVLLRAIGCTQGIIYTRSWP
jgi:hypothetical protein